MRVYVECSRRDKIGMMTRSVTYCSKMLDVPGTLSQDTAQFPRDYKISETYQACIFTRLN